MNTQSRTWILIAIFLGIQTVILVIQRGYTAAEVVFPQSGLDSLPLAIGEWKGTHTELDKRIFPFLGTTTTENRLYSDSNGHLISLHMALWPNVDSLLPHLPQACYSNAGWTLKEQKTVKLKPATAPPVDTSLLTFKRENKMVRVLFWFQQGESVFWSKDGAKQIKREMWGKRKIPALMKVMLQLEVKDDSQSETRLRDFAQEVYAWSRKL